MQIRKENKTSKTNEKNHRLWIWWYVHYSIFNKKNIICFTLNNELWLYFYWEQASYIISILIGKQTDFFLIFVFLSVSVRFCFYINKESVNMEGEIKWNSFSKIKDFLKWKWTYFTRNEFLRKKWNPFVND